MVILDRASANELHGNDLSCTPLGCLDVTATISVIDIPTRSRGSHFYAYLSHYLSYADCDISLGRVVDLLPRSGLPTRPTSYQHTISLNSGVANPANTMLLTEVVRRFETRGITSNLSLADC
jgi:hypothetical protein